MLAWSSEHPYRPKFLAHMLAWDPTLCLPKIQAYSQFRKPDPPSKPHQHDNLGLCPPLPHLGRYQAHAEITRFALSSWAQAPRSSHTPACAIPKASCKPTPQGLHEPAPHQQKPGSRAGSLILYGDQNPKSGIQCQGNALCLHPKQGTHAYWNTECKYT